MATQRITVAENFDMVKAFLLENGADEALVAFIEDRKVKAQKKTSSKPKALTEEQTLIRDEIVRVLTESEVALSISEMQRASEVLAGCSTSKVSGNLTPMLEKNGGNIKREMDKKTAKFSI